MKINPDDRKDNVDKIQQNINNTIKNCELCDEAIERTDDEKTKTDLTAKNKRREESLHAMRSEIEDEATDKKNGYK